MRKNIDNAFICALFKLIELWLPTMMKMFRVLWGVSDEDVNLLGNKKSNREMLDSNRWYAEKTILVELKSMLKLTLNYNYSKFK